MPYLVTTKRPEPIPRDYWREVPCGHPPDPVAMYGPDGDAACHCGRLLFFEDALPERPPEAPGPIVPCSKCGCYVAVPASPTMSVSRVAVATLEEAHCLAHDLAKPGPRGERYNHQAALLLPESGGTVGPLPDGTLIEVEPTSWHDLRYRSGPIQPLDMPNAHLYSAEHVGEAELHPALAQAILAAFNARDAGQ